MAGELPITLAVEDELSESLLRKLLIHTGRNYLVGAVYGKKGAGFLKQKLLAFNNAAKGSCVLILTDLDNRPCAPDLIETWFACPIANYKSRKSRNLIFRVAVREVEAWILADRERFAEHFGVSINLISKQPDILADPKASLLAIVAKSRKRSLREDIVPAPGNFRKIGPDYNGRLGEFIHTRWRPEVAILQSPSLAKCLAELTAFSPAFR